MKVELNTPGIEQIYAHKYLYEQHRRKLTHIHAQRRSNLIYDSARMQHFDHIKESKNQTFKNRIHKFNANVANENMKFLGRLEKVRPSLKHIISQKKEKTFYSFITPYQKERMYNAEKQNHRISNRMRNMSSSLNQKHFLRDFAKSQQIKSRITRYTTDAEKKVKLKSQRYFSNTDEHNHSVTSQFSRSKQKVKNRRTAASYYHKEDILKNKIQGRNARKFRPNTSDHVEKNEDDSFFTTEPRRAKFISKKVYI